MFKIPFLNKIKSLRAKITIIIIIIALIVQSIFSFIKIFDERNKIFKDIEITQEQIVDELSNSIIAPLWDFNYEQAKLLINIKLKTRDFIGVVIYDNETDKVLIGLKKEKDETIETYDFSEKKYITVSKKISFQDTVYWKADFYFTDEYIKKIIIQNIIFYILSTIILTGVLSIFE